MRRIQPILVCVLAVQLFGCSTGEIANLEQIRIENVLRERDLLIVVISLRDGNGNQLVWVNTAIGLQGGGVLSEDEFDTEVVLYSMKDGREHKEVYHGRLRDLHWNQIIADNPRVLVGEIPFHLIEIDPERDSPHGVIEVTLKTPKQGDLFDRAENVELYLR